MNEPSDKDLDDLRALAKADGEHAVSEHADREAEAYAMHREEQAAVSAMRRADAALSMAKAGRATSVANLVGATTFLMLVAPAIYGVTQIVQAFR